MTLSPLITGRPKSGRRPPLLVGLVMIVASAVAYLGWQHFAQPPHCAPGAASARSGHRRDGPAAKLSDRADRHRQCHSAEHGDGAQHGHGADRQRRFQGRPVRQERRAAGAARSEHLSGAARSSGGQSRPRRGPSRKRADQLEPIRPACQAGFAPQQQVATQQAKIAPGRATIKADQAAVEYAKTELSYTKLVAPFDGVAGIRLLDVGNIIHSSTTRGAPTEPNALVVINQVQPISVMFTLAAADIPAGTGRAGKGPGQGDRIERGRQDASSIPARSPRSTTRPNTTSGTITLKAIFPNPHRQLWPGMFVNVRVVTASAGQRSDGPARRRSSRGRKGSSSLSSAPITKWRCSRSRCARR